MSNTSSSSSSPTQIGQMTPLNEEVKGPNYPSCVTIFDRFMYCSTPANQIDH